MPSGSFDAAMIQLEGAFRAAPASRLFAPLAEAYRQAGQLQKAVELLQKGTQRHPEYVAAWVLLGLCQREMAGSQAAEITFARVLRMDPENLVALKHRARRGLEEGDAPTAAALVDRVLEIDPYDREALSLRDEVSSSTPSQLTAGAEPVTKHAPPPPEKPSATDATPRMQPSAPVEPAEEEPPLLDLRELLDEEGLEESRPVAPRSAETELQAEWQVQRDADRIVIRPKPEKGDAAAAPPRSDELSTLTLARIYESQGYDDKALAIYQTLLQRDPENAELQERLRALQERVGHSKDAGAEEKPERRWRLLNAETLGEETEQAAENLRSLTDRVRDREEDKRHTVIGRVPARKPPAAPTPEASRSDEPDFERFLRYVRSLKQ